MFISRRKKMMTYKSEASIVFRTKIYLPNQAFIPCFYFQVYDRPLFWNFPLMICNFPLLLSHSKNIWMSTLITIIITYCLLIIIIIIITKSHNNYCSVGVMELCLLNLLILINCFLCSSYPCVLFEGFHMWLTRNHMFISEIWEKFASFIL